MKYIIFALLVALAFADINANVSACIDGITEPTGLATCETALEGSTTTDFDFGCKATADAAVASTTEMS